MIRKKKNQPAPKGEEVPKPISALTDWYIAHLRQECICPGKPCQVKPFEDPPTAESCRNDQRKERICSDEACQIEDTPTAESCRKKTTVIPEKERPPVPLCTKKTCVNIGKPESSSGSEDEYIQMLKRLCDEDHRGTNKVVPRRNTQDLSLKLWKHRKPTTKPPTPSGNSARELIEDNKVLKEYPFFFPPKTPEDIEALQTGAESSGTKSECNCIAAAPTRDAETQVGRENKHKKVSAESDESITASPLGGANNKFSKPKTETPKEVEGEACTWAGSRKAKSRGPKHTTVSAIEKSMICTAQETILAEHTRRQTDVFNRSCSLFKPSSVLAELREIVHGTADSIMKQRD